MAVRVKNGVVIFSINNNLNGSSAISIGVYMDRLVHQGAQKILLDFSQVRNFEYFGMAVLMDILLQYKKKREIKIDLQGLNEECLTAARYLGFERVLEG